jgi:RND family efflux transporter MFP subunit
MSESSPNHAVDLNRLKIDKNLKQPTSKGWKAFLFLVGLIILAGIVWLFWSKNNIPSVELTEVQQVNNRQQSAVLNASGYVTPRQRATVAAKVTGRVNELFIDEGMKVQKGQVLAGIDSIDAQKQIDAAKADVVVAEAGIIDLRVNRDEAQRNLNRFKEIYNKGLLSQKDLDNSQTALDSFNARIETAQKQTEAARARLKVYEQDLDNYTIRAPFDGIVVSKDAQIGEMVSPFSAGGGFTRTGIATIVDMNSLEIEVDINEAYIARVVVGQRVEATLDAYPDWKIPASVRTVIPTADRQKATVKVRITFDMLDPKILPDMGIKVAFLEEKKQNAESGRPRLSLKSSAILTVDNRAYVFVYKSGVVERREIKAGESKNDITEVLSGLNPGDQIVDNPSEKLKDGAKVKITK